MKIFKYVHPMTLVFGLIGVPLFLTGLFANNFYGEIPNYVVNDLNNGKSVQEYESFLLAFIHGGVIKPLPQVLEITFVSLGLVLVYLAAFIHVNGKNFESLRLLASLDFWINFFAFKYKEVVVSKEVAEQMKRDRNRRMKEELKAKESKSGDEKERNKRAALRKIRKK